MVDRKQVKMTINLPEHACMLDQEPVCPGLPPTAGTYRHFLCRLQLMTLACEWHHHAAIFLRSEKSLKIERQRQLALRTLFVWHPYSCIKFYWGTFVTAVDLLTLVYLPCQVFRNCPNPLDPFILFGDVLSFMDMGFKFITGYMDADNRSVILDRKLIAINYLKFNFIFDFISALPLQIIQPYKNCIYPSHTTMFIFKLFRIITISRNWKSFYEQLDLPYKWSVIITAFIQMVVFFHWLTYLHYQAPAVIANMFSDDLSTYDYWLSRTCVNRSEPILSKYINNLYQVVGLCIGMGYSSSLTEHNLTEKLYCMAIGVIGTMFLTNSFMGVLRFVIYTQNAGFLYNSRIRELEAYMDFKGLPKSLQRKIQMFLDYKYNVEFFNESQILNTINEHLHHDINMHCCRGLVMNVPLFHDIPVAVLNAIIISLSHMLVLPGNAVVKSGDPGGSLYLIASGTVAVMDCHGKEIAHLRDGGYFGETALMRPGTLRSITVIALEITEIYKLSSSSFHECIDQYPHLKRKMESNMRHLSRNFSNIY